MIGSLDPRTTLGIFALAAAATVVAVLVIASFVRARGTDQASFGIYESGAPTTGPATAPVPTAYFQIAAFFVIFDFEAALLFTWAIAAREAGVAGLISAAIFIVVLLAALAYLWLDGALDVGARSRGGARRGGEET